jgi:predicted kinase
MKLHRAVYQPLTDGFVSMVTEKTVTILRGLPGSGKSTYARKHHGGAVICSADSFFVDEEGNYRFQKLRIADAHQHCLNRFITAVLADERDVVVDNTNTCLWEYEKYILLGKKYGYSIRIIRMHADESNLESLVVRNVHNVDRRTMRHMFDRFEDDRREHIVHYPF